MISKININNIACFKSAATLETDKKVNLIYGLNGTGKTTISDYLYDTSNSVFFNCGIDGYSNEEILVYNQRFIRDYFYSPDNLKGIFTLSKENKEAEELVKKADEKIVKLEDERKSKNDELDKTNTDFQKKKQKAINKTWEIKTDYSGGDRVLEFCLTGLMGRKDNLFNHINKQTTPSQKPIKTTDQLKKEVEAIQGSSAQKYELLSKIEFSANSVESNQIFQKIIIGNESCVVADLIKKLENSDWVKQGLDYLPEKIDIAGEQCPFCQERTITKDLSVNIKNYFDKTYEEDIGQLAKLLSTYDSAMSSLPQIGEYETIPFIVSKKDEFENLYNSLIHCIRNNRAQIIEKQKNPSQKFQLTDSSNKIAIFNEFIDAINEEIKKNNEKIDNKEASLKEIKNQFWDIMRWDYDQTLGNIKSEENLNNKKQGDINKALTDIENKISEQKKIVQEQQKKTVNIEEAINNINNGLIELGIDGFKIERHSDVLYKLVRTEQCDDTFQTLSEGEKMIISFLYFRELCKGKKSATSPASKKIIVIDDPISSLSHIYIFNIGQLIKNDFFNSNLYEQVFLLTHSLYFFYEMTDTNRERRKENQKLFRIEKNSNGSWISEMKYEEIQNDYHSYWLIVKDEKQPPALIANCMRNIVEYFFNFIEKKDLNNVFQKPVLQQTKYQAFCRYINRESHSLGQNIFDFKEFNYQDFKEALGLVFVEAGYKDHYKAMTK
jgi:wobble nucleotide-excising tRNase